MRGLTGGDGEVGRGVVRGVAVALAVRTTGAAGLGASSQRLIDDGLDRARATATLGATAETAVDLLGVAWQVLGTVDRTTNIVVTQHIAGTNDHF